MANQSEPDAKQPVAEIAVPSPSSGDEDFELTEADLNGETLEDAEPQSLEGSQDVSEPVEPINQEAIQQDGAPQRKPTRAERRIKNLVSQLKDKEQEAQPDRSKLIEPEPLIRDEDFQNGVDPQELLRRQQQNQQATVEQTKAQIKAEMAYEQAFIDHVSDAEKVSQELANDPDLDEEVAEQYQLVNRVLNPVTGELIWAPIATMSEIKAKLEARRSRTGTKAIADAGTKLHKLSQEGMLQPAGASATPQKDDFLDGFESY